jgi:hypothetical protein
VVAQLFLLLNSEQQGSVGAKDGTRGGPQAANAKLNALKSQVLPCAIAGHVSGTFALAGVGF